MDAGVPESIAIVVALAVFAAGLVAGARSAYRNGWSERERGRDSRNFPESQ